MRYVMLVCVDESIEVSPAEALPDAWVQEMDGRGVRRIGTRLRPVSDATTVRVRDGEVLLTDGPFAETKEQIGGLRPHRVRRPRRGHRGRRQAPGAPGSARSRCGRSGTMSRRRRGSRRRRVPRRVGPRRRRRLIRMTGDWDLAEECAQDAFAQALERWPRDGVPRAPGRLAHHDGAQPRARPAAPRRDRGRQAAGGRAMLPHADGPDDDGRRRQPFGTTGCA